MKQLTQQLKSGKMDILDVPSPILGEGQVLIRNHYSVISSGTEGKTVSDARKGYLAKARSRQKEVKMVLDAIKTEGIVQTYNLVLNKLEVPSPLGYSCCGEVIAVGNKIKDIKVGDFVAAGGDGAFHAEIVAVSRNLCVKIPGNVDLREASFATLASIAIQGIRQADLRFGENCVVIGLGLLGLITIKLLRAAGIVAIGVDINKMAVDKAIEIGADAAFSRNIDGIESIIANLTAGNGADAVIITAGSSSLDPIEFAGEVARKKGKVVIVGAVPTGFSRANYFRKELEVRMSSSYGPGRYDATYEEKGIDYPIGYVRFTENRNMQTYIDFLSKGKITANDLISHSFSINDSPLAYDMILSKKEMVIGVIIEYDVQDKAVIENPAEKNKLKQSSQNFGIGLIGAGNYALSTILPIIKNRSGLIAVCSTRGTNSHFISKKFNFQYNTNNIEEIFSDKSINTLFVLTRHNTHAEFILKSIKAGKNVFVEKPLCLYEEELKTIQDCFYSNSSVLFVGFNRRFSPFIKQIQNEVDPLQKKAITIRVNAGILPSNHWVHDREIGGGRIVGEVCHFIDLACFLGTSKVKSVHASAIDDFEGANDTLNISLKFENGSIASISYLSNGNKNVPKERVEIFADGVIYQIDDFLSMNIYKGTKKTVKLSKQDKGHQQEIDSFFETVKSEHRNDDYFESILHSTLVTFKILESLRNNAVVYL